MNDWNALRNRNIIDLFIGDKEVDNNSIFYKISMPYMSGQYICDFGRLLGINIEYSKEKLSRWEYMDRIINYSIETNKINYFFEKLIDKERFDYLVDASNYYESPETMYWSIS